MRSVRVYLYFFVRMSVRREPGKAKYKQLKLKSKTAHTVTASAIIKLATNS